MTDDGSYEKAKNDAMKAKVEPPKNRKQARRQFRFLKSKDKELAARAADDTFSGTLRRHFAEKQLLAASSKTEKNKAKRDRQGR